jgi:hypothetical protein
MLLVKIRFFGKEITEEALCVVSTEPQINQYIIAKRRETSRLYETANGRDVMLRVSNYK